MCKFNKRILAVLMATVLMTPISILVTTRGEGVSSPILVAEENSPENSPTNVFGNPDPPDWKDVSVEDTADFIIVNNADNLIFKFRKGTAGYNEIWENDVQIVADERWVVEYLFNPPDTWKTRGLPQYIEWEQPENYHATVRRFYDDFLGTTFWVVYDFYGGFRPKISVEMEVGQEDNYRIAWKASGINKTFVENKTNYVRFWNEGEEAIVFDYSDVYETFGDITEIEIEEWAGDHKLNEYFNVGRLEVGDFGLDPTFGYDTKGASYLNLANYIWGSWFTCPESGTADNLTAYLNTTLEETTPNIKGAMYKRSDGSFVDNTEEFSLPNDWDGWKTFNFINSPSIEEGVDYIFVLWWDAKLRFYGTVETEKGAFRFITYGEWPNPLSAGSYNVKFSIYCSYTAGAPATPGKPALVSPENNYSTSDNTPTFVWENGSDATSHRLVIDNSQGFDDGENIYDNTNAWDNSGTTIENELPNDNYWWKVCAVNAQGENWSENTWTFEVTKEAGEEYERPVEQGFSLAGAAPRGAEFGREIEQGFSVGVVVAIASEVCKLLSQVFGFTGAAGAALVRHGELSEGLSFTGAVGAREGYGRSLSGGFSFSAPVDIEVQTGPKEVERDVAQGFSISGEVDMTIPPAPTPAPFDWVAAAMFIFPIVLMAIAFAFDNVVFVSFAGIVFILSGLFFVDVIWLAIIFVGIGIYLLLTAFLSEED